MKYCKVYHPDNIEATDKKIITNREQSKKKKNAEDNKVSNNIKGEKVEYSNKK